MKVVQLISWEADLPVWILDPKCLPRQEQFELLVFISNLVLDPTVDQTRVSLPLPLGEGREARITHIEWHVRGLDISKNDPSKGYFLSQLLLGTEPKEVDPDEDPWSDERHDREIDVENDRRRGDNLARRLVLLGGSVFLANRAPLNKDEEEALFLLAEHRLNERAIELQRLRRRVERQRRILVPGTGTTQGQRRALSDELVRFILERDQVCQECGTGEDLQLDHVIPVSRGGNDSEDNLRVLCGACNRARGNLQ